MKTLILSLFISLPIYAQTTHTTVSVEGNQTITGDKTFSGTTTLNSLTAGAATLSGNVQVKGPSPWIDVLSYGAVGDGTTDDLTALTNALTACPVGGTVYFPAKTYAVSNALTVPTGCNLVGQGAGVTEASSTMTGANIKAISASFPTSGVAVLKFHDVTHSSLSRLSVDCNNVALAVGILYDSDNSPPSSLNTFEHFTVKGCHMAFVNGLISSSVTAPATCLSSPNTSGCTQADTYRIEDFLFLGNCSDFTGEGVHVNSSNAGQGSVISRGNIQCYNIGARVYSTNGLLWFEHFNGGSPVGSTPTLIQTETNVAGSVNLLDLESEGSWSKSVVDHACNPLGTNAVSSWIGNAWNSIAATVDGCDNVFSQSNQTNSATVSASTANIVSINETGWTTGGTATAANLITLNTTGIVTGSNIVSAKNVAGQGSGCPGFPGGIIAGDLQACENGTHAGRLYLGQDLALLNNGDGVIDAGGTFKFNTVAQWPETTAPSGVAARDVCYGDSTAHALECSYNNGTFLKAPQIITASLTTTAATTDNVTVTGMVSTGHCYLTPTNSGAAGGIASVFISAKTTNQITVTHTATSGWTFDVVCSPQ